MVWSLTVRNAVFGVRSMAFVCGAASVNQSQTLFSFQKAGRKSGLIDFQQSRPAKAVSFSMLF
jgi:hypothetical protein